MADRNIAQKLAKKLRKAGADGTIPLTGYVEAGDETVRIFKDLEMMKYIEVRNPDVLHVTYGGSARHLSTVLVRRDAHVRSVTVRPATDYTDKGVGDGLMTLFQQIGPAPDLGGPGGGFWSCAAHGIKTAQDSYKSCKAGGFSTEFCEEAAGNTGMKAYRDCMNKSKPSAPDSGDVK